MPILSILKSSVLFFAYFILSSSFIHLHAFSIPKDLHQHVIFACNNIKFTGGASFQPAFYQDRTLWLQGEAEFSGNVFVDGEVYYNPEHVPEVSGQASITALYPYQESLPCEPLDIESIIAEVEATHDNDLIPLTEDGNQALTEEGDLVLFQDSLNLPKGTYFFHNLLLQQGATLSVEGGSFLVIENEMTLKSHARLTASGRVTLIIGEKAEVKDHAHLEGYMYMPEGELTLKSQSSFIGRLHVASLEASGGASLRSDAYPAVLLCKMFAEDDGEKKVGVTLLVRKDFLDSFTETTVRWRIAPNAEWRIIEADPFASKPSFTDAFGQHPDYAVYPDSVSYTEQNLKIEGELILSGSPEIRMAFKEMKMYATAQEDPCPKYCGGSGFPPDDEYGCSACTGSVDSHISGFGGQFGEIVYIVGNATLADTGCIAWIPERFTGFTTICENLGGACGIFSDCEMYNAFMHKQSYDGCIEVVCLEGELAHTVNWGIDTPSGSCPSNPPPDSGTIYEPVQADLRSIVTPSVHEGPACNVAYSGCSEAARCIIAPFVETSVHTRTDEVHWCKYKVDGYPDEGTNAAVIDHTCYICTGFHCGYHDILVQDRACLFHTLIGEGRTSTYQSCEDEPCYDEDCNNCVGPPSAPGAPGGGVSGPPGHWGSVQVTTGLEVYRDTDFVLPGKNGLDVVFSRYFNRLRARIYENWNDWQYLGKYWYHTYQQFLTKLSDYSYLLLKPDNSHELYLLGNDGVFYASLPKHARGQLNFLDPDTAQLTYPDGRKITFVFYEIRNGKRRFKPIKIEDELGNHIDFYYINAGSPLIDYIIDTYGHIIDFTYYDDAVEITLPNKDNPLIFRYEREVINPCGSYAYRPLSKVIYPDGRERRYTYDRCHGDNIEVIKDKADHILQDINYFDYWYVNAINLQNIPNYMQFQYDKANHQTTVLDALGNPTTYSYELRDGVRLVTEVSGNGGCGGGQCQQVWWDENNHKGQTMDGRGVITKYIRDSYGNILQKIEAAGTSLERVTTYTYEDPAKGLVKTITQGSVDQLGQDATITFTYEPDTSLIKRKTEIGYAHGEQQIHETTYTYDSAGRLIMEDGPRTLLEDITHYIYYPDTVGTSPKDHPECATDDLLNAGRLCKVINALGHETFYGDYDIWGNPGKVIDPNGVITEYQYDPMGRLITKTVKGDAVETEDLITQYVYTDDGLLDYVIYPEGNIVDYGYGEVIDTSHSEIFPHWLTSVEYKGAGRANQDPGSEGGERIAYVLDRKGRKIKEIYYTWEGGWIEKGWQSFVYDGYDQLVEVHLPDGSYRRYGYDANGNLIYEDDANWDKSQASHQRTYDYDPLNRLIRVTERGDQGVQVTEYAYDTQDNLIQVTDPHGNITTFRYDDFGNLIEERAPGKTRIQYFYDDANNLLYVYAPDEQKWLVEYYWYDELNRPIFVHHYQMYDQYYYYDWGASGRNLIGRLSATALGPGNRYVFSYDRLGNIAELYRVMGSPPDPGEVILPYTYQYNKNGFLKGMTYPSGQIVTYQRDYRNRIKNIAGALAGQNFLYASQIKHDPFGNITHALYGNGIEEIREYNALGFITHLKYQKDGLPIWESNYTTDHEGNILSIADGMGQPMKEYVYDGFYRLKEAKDYGQDRIWQYGYDAIGNRLSKKAFTLDTGEILEDWLYTYRLNIQGQNTPILEQAADNLSGTQWNYNYDLVGRVSSDGRWINQWADNFYNNPSMIYDFTFPQARYSYRPDFNGLLHTLVKEEGNQCINRYLYRAYDGRLLGFNEGILGTPADAATLDFCHLPVQTISLHYDRIYLDDRPIAMVKSPVGGPVEFIGYQHQDHLGTTILQTDSQGSVIGEGRYSPFGDLIATPVNTSPYPPIDRLPGMYKDWAETGLDYYYNGYRWYDPNLGRYLAQDPLRPFFDQFYEYEPYPYVSSNPINITDPYGLFKIDPKSCGCKLEYQLPSVVKRTCSYFMYFLANYFRAQVINIIPCLRRACREAFIQCKDKCEKGYYAEAPLGFPCKVYICTPFKTLGYRDKHCMIIHELSHCCGETDSMAFLQNAACPLSVTVKGR